MSISIRFADFADQRLHRFLQAHLDDIAPTAPAESRHALDLSGLQRPGMRVWVAQEADSIVGTAALAPLQPGWEELKSMRTDPERRGQGIASRMLDHVITDARERQIGRLSLETGSMDFFSAARALYRKYGFVECEPFGAYRPDPNSTFMTREI